MSRRTIVDDLCQIKIIKDDYYEFDRRASDEIARLRRLAAMSASPRRSSGSGCCSVADTFAANKAAELRQRVQDKRRQTLESLINLY